MEFSFAPPDLITIGVLIVLEALLSADNALVMAIMVRHLPPDQQKRALMYGLWGAFVLRAIAIIGASYITRFWWLQLAGALYLIWLPLKHFVSHSSGKEVKNKPMGFWQTVIAVDLMDLAFALDSVLVAVSFVDTAHHPDKMWVVVTGAILGIILLRFAASYFIRLLEKYPMLEHVAYLLIGWAGIKMLLISGQTFEAVFPTALPFPIHHMPDWVFWGGIILIGVGGGSRAFSKAQAIDPEVEAEAHMLEEAYDYVLTPEALLEDWRVALGLESDADLEEGQAVLRERLANLSEGDAQPFLEAMKTWERTED